MRRGDLMRATTVALQALAELDTHDRDNHSTEFAQLIWAHRIVLNAMVDISYLQEVMSKDNWIETPEAVEAAWDLVNDAKKRLNGYIQIQPEFLSFCMRPIEIAFAQIDERYGRGIYTSWEVLIERYDCSVCEKDTRACSHIAGMWYGGRECVYIARGIQPDSLSIVEYPEDPRCRIWPWKRRPDGEDGSIVFAVRIFHQFHPDGRGDGGTLSCDLALDPIRIGLLSPHFLHPVRLPAK